MLNSFKYAFRIGPNSLPYTGNHYVGEGPHRRCDHESVLLNYLSFFFFLSITSWSRKYSRFGARALVRGARAESDVTPNSRLLRDVSVLDFSFAIGDEERELLVTGIMHLFLGISHLLLALLLQHVPAQVIQLFFF